MTQISVRLENTDRIRTGLNNWAKRLLGITKRHVKAALERAKRVVTTYPPELPSQAYIRTGVYGRSFDVIESGLTYTLRSDAISPRGQAYTRYVGGMADGTGQAYIHQGRWPVIRDAVDAEVETLTEDLNGEIARAARQEGLGL